MNVIERTFFELGLIWAEIARWTMAKDPAIIVGLMVMIILILYLILVIATELIGGRR